MITLILTLALVGLITWAVVTYVPMPPAISRLIIILIVILIVLYIIRILGIGDIPVPRIR